MAQIIKTIFQFRRGKAATWVKNNPILRIGEPGYEKDTGRLKIGDGETPWNELKYFLGDYIVAPDNNSLTINDDSIQLYGFKEAAEGQIPRKKNSKLEWIDSESISSEPLSQEEILSILQ